MIEVPDPVEDDASEEAPEAVEEAATIAAEFLGGRYLHTGDFMDIVHSYCLLGPVEKCVQRLREYIDAGARHIIFSICCPREDRSRRASGEGVRGGRRRSSGRLRGSWRR